MADADGPLVGLRVLDLTSVVLGPMAAQHLGDMGAEVIKIEPPEGDVTREIGPRRSEKMGALFLANNRNKRSVVLDLKRQDAQAALMRLVERADVLMHSIRPSSAARLGIGFEALSARNPRLVFCHLMGFSDAGLYAGRAAYDDIVQALAGYAMLQQVVGGEPRYIPSILADKTTAIHAAYAIMLALFARERSGRGQKVAVPMFETMTSFMAAEHLGGRVFDPPVGDMGYAPVRRGMRRPFKTKDGYLCFMPYTDENWRQFVELIGEAELAADPRFMTQKGRQANIELVWAEVGRQLAKRTNAEWLALIGGSDIPFAVLNELEDLLTDPHLESVGFWRLFDHETEGRLRLPANPIQMSATPPSVRRLPPRLGQHSVEVFEEYGFSPSEIASLLGKK